MFLSIILFGGEFLNIAYSQGDTLNIYLHNNILQHHFGSNLIFLNFKQNFPRILLWKHSKINSHLRKQPWFLLTCLKIASILLLGDKDYHL
jgi:hypothetical protein